MARYPELAARSFIIGSFGKTYHVTGWKVGYAVAPAALTTEFRKVHQFVTFSTHTPVQFALADFLGDLRGLAELGPFFQRKRDLFLRLMEGSRFSALPSRGSYFQLMDYSAITTEADADFAVRLTREYGVASIPTSPFLSRSCRPAGPEILFREEGRHARACRRAPAPGVDRRGAIGGKAARAVRPSAPDAERQAFLDGAVRVGAGQLNHVLAGAEPRQRQCELRDVVAGRAVGAFDVPHRIAAFVQHSRRHRHCGSARVDTRERGSADDRRARTPAAKMAPRRGRPTPSGSP